MRSVPSYCRACMLLGGVADGNGGVLSRAVSVLRTSFLSTESVQDALGLLEGRHFQQRC